VIPGYLVVNMILRVPVPAGALEPRRDDQPGFLEPAPLLAVYPDTVIPGSGDPGPFLQVVQCGSVGPVQDLLERLLPPGPVHGRPLVSSEAARRSFSRIEACSTEMDLENETVTSV